ncbi:hypothetical protein [Burkholderia ambifaria]|uniref:hypothetical protein n=1 Tax=Burkholderia ambifaria TaxID=152480 RepID=UPI002012B822|nr:hypothetical protein [Burkholderia ambifaria]
MPFVIAFGPLVTLSSTVLASNGTAYQSELFPTAIRGRALGFVHSIGRLTGADSSFIIALLLERAGVSAVFALIGGSIRTLILHKVNYQPSRFVMARLKCPLLAT